MELGIHATIALTVAWHFLQEWFSKEDKEMHYITASYQSIVLS